MFARGGQIRAPREVLNELRWVADDELRHWAETFQEIFIGPDSGQIGVAREIVNTREFAGLLDLDSELPDADPFVVALAVVGPAGGTLFTGRQPWTVVADADGQQSHQRPMIPDVCRDTRYKIRAITAFQLLAEFDVHLPPVERGLGSIYGLWRGVDITEEDIEGAKFRGGNS